jgi:hypothetical protein
MSPKAYGFSTALACFAVFTLITLLFGRLPNTFLCVLWVFGAIATGYVSYLWKKFS